MFKSLFAVAALVLCAQAGASTEVINVNQIANPFVSGIRPTAMLKWTVGDSADYNIGGGIMNGTMHIFVREETNEGFWLQQDLKLGFLGDHKMETLIDKNTGKILEMKMDGQKQTPPDPSNQEIVDSKRDSVTVPKGTFDCMWVKIHDKKENTDSQSWINPTIVPISGMLKTIAPSQMGEVTVELTDFLKH